MAKFNSQQIEATVMEVTTFANTKVLELIEDLAQVIKNTGDDFPARTTFLENCGKAQASYNSWVEVARKWLDEAGNLFNLSEAIAKRLNVSGVSAREASTSLGATIDTSHIPGMG